jgi:hypothetical protein
MSWASVALAGRADVNRHRTARDNLGAVSFQIPDDRLRFPFHSHVCCVMGGIQGANRIGIQRGKQRLEIHLLGSGLRDQLKRLAQCCLRSEAANEHPSDLAPTLLP